jgi:hypothetical protein
MSGERGSLTPMIIGFVIIALLGVTVVANASKAFLYRRSLVSWADGAAIVAAQSVSDERIYTGAFDDLLPLASGRAEAEVADYVRRHGVAGRFEQFTVAAVEVDPAGETVTVRFRARVPLIWANETTTGLGGGMPIAAEATARAPLFAD